MKLGIVGLPNVGKVHYLMQLQKLEQNQLTTHSAQSNQTLVL